MELEEASTVSVLRDQKYRDSFLILTSRLKLASALHQRVDWSTGKALAVMLSAPHLSSMRAAADSQYFLLSQ
jgi:hypothetical protein